VAEIVTGVEAATALVVTEKVLEVVPADTLTLAGTVAIFVSELLNVTTAPPAGAGIARITLPVDETPPITLAGLTDRVKAALTSLTVTVISSLAERLGLPLSVTTTLKR
jgi:hypothetical protein